MCIACELGYWSMLDAFEVERKASPERGAADGGTAVFECAPVGQSAPLQDHRAAPPADESAS